ncbi:hypothetical protein RFI_05723 [Reticulomyxa filosa]|uniref:Ubiquitin carboxyl-terminal hydrolase n=1 Tax=Reticulomyxa filosa TaxID=46433 RepID=X6P1H9_RETFI|nr:hypothetical protein RFI_05723 [Reticulomyxa filosa]|eukprot:ETO31397.1 hypothetical protein RFI_05723 [Reticulomyxa filosa]
MSQEEAKEENKTNTEKKPEKVEKGDETEEVEEGNWLPLESNPEVLNDFARRMGLPEDYAFHEVFGFDEETLAFTPQPVLAAVLLFPSSKNIKAFKAKQRVDIEANGQVLDNSLFYLYQHDNIGNACGTIAMIHCLSNSVPLSDGPLSTFTKSTKDMNWIDRGWALLKAKDIQEVSDETAASEANQTDTPERTDDTDGHFIAFVQKSGMLFELDGRKKFPINHGETSEETFLHDVVKVVKEKFMALEPNNVNFNLMTLSQEQAEED